LDHLVYSVVRQHFLLCGYSMDNFCLPVNADYIADTDLWRTCGYTVRSPSHSIGRDNVASLRSPAAFDDDEHISSNACLDDVYHHQQPHRPPSPVDDISSEPMFSFSSRTQSNAYVKYAIRAIYNKVAVVSISYSYSTS